MTDYHHQNLTDGALPLWRHGRAWWWGIAWEWNVFRNTRLLQASVGRWGFSVYLLWFSLSLTRRSLDCYSPPAWEIGWSDGAITLESPWVRQMEWRSSDPWWRKRIRLEVVDWILGRWKHECVKGEPFDVVVPMPEGCYRATATPEVRTWGRRFWITKRRESVWLDIEGGGIPHSGKGENSYDCGDDGLCGTGGDTVEEAIGNAVASALKSRRNYGLDSKRTGGAPVMAQQETRT